MVWTITVYLAVGILFALIVRPLTPVAWVYQIALWPLSLLLLIYLAKEEIVLTALVVVPLVLLLFWYLG
jgi:hypothetical protein